MFCLHRQNAWSPVNGPIFILYMFSMNWPAVMINYCYVRNNLRDEVSVPSSVFSGGKQPTRLIPFFGIPNMTAKVKGHGRCNRPLLRRPTVITSAEWSFFNRAHTSFSECSSDKKLYVESEWLGIKPVRIHCPAPLAITVTIIFGSSLLRCCPRGLISFIYAASIRSNTRQGREKERKMERIKFKLGKICLLKPLPLFPLTAATNLNL